MKTKFLGKNEIGINYSGSSKILDPIVRQKKLSDIVGVDYWNAYEFTYLDSNRRPVLKVVELNIPASSPITVESKSLKLYLNSFYKKKFISESVVLNKIIKDLSKLTKSEVKAKFIRKFSKEPK